MTASIDPAAERHHQRGRHLRILIAILLLVPILASQIPVAPVAAGDPLTDAIAQQQKLNKTIAAQKKQMQSLTAMQGGLESQIATTRSNLASINKDLNQLAAEVNGLKVQIGKVQAQYQSLVAQLANLERQLKDIEAQEVAKQAELDQRRALLAKRLVAAYQTGQTSLLEQLLTSKSLSDVLNQVSYYIDVSQADKALALEVQRDQEVLAELHKTVVGTRDATEQMRAQTAAQKKRLDGQMAQLSAAQARLAALQRQTQIQLAQQRAAEQKLAQNKTALAAAIRANGAAQAALGKKIDALAAQAASRGNVPSVYNGSLRWPMGGSVSQEYGCTGFPSEPPVGSCAHFHQGIDLVAPCYTPIFAAGPGTVVFVGFNPYDAPPAAWIVIVAHSSGLETWYAHMTAGAPGGIYQGAHVNAGQLVGTENTTGHSTGCHLHWAVRLNGNFVNPRLFV